MEITSYHVITTIIGVVGIFVGVLGRKDNEQNTQSRDNNHAIWKSIEGLRADLDALNEKLYREYYDKPALREYIGLTLNPILNKIEHVDGEVGEIKDMLCKLIQDKS